MRVVITGGPSSEPIDEVRVLTNRSTGELAVTLFDQFKAAGHKVDLLLGEGARCWRSEAKPFGRNEDLEVLLQGCSTGDRVGMVLHAAALADFAVQVTDAAGLPLRVAKVASRGAPPRLLLTPKPKVIATLRRLFPEAFLVGWKLEHDGDPAALLEAAKAQIREHRLDRCVVNGRAYGPGFGVCSGSGLLHHAPDKGALAGYFATWAAQG